MEFEERVAAATKAKRGLRSGSNPKSGAAGVLASAPVVQDLSSCSGASSRVAECDDTIMESTRASTARSSTPPPDAEPVSYAGAQTSRDRDSKIPEYKEGPNSQDFEDVSLNSPSPASIVNSTYRVTRAETAKEKKAKKKEYNRKMEEEKKRIKLGKRD